MISSKSIRFHISSNTYIIPKNFIFDQNVSINGNAIVGAGVRFWKNVKIFGDVQLGKGCIIEGNLNADNIIVGAQSKIKGNIIASGNISLFQNSVVKSIKSNESITIMEGCFVGYADSKRLEIIGKAEIKKIGSVTKVTVRADTIALPEDETEIEDQIKSEEFVIDEFASEEFAIDESASEEFAIDESASEEFVIDESASEEFVIDESASEEFVIDESVSEEFVIGESTSEEFVIGESTSEDLIIEKTNSKRNPLENNKIEQLLTQPPDSTFAEIIDGSNENLDSKSTPLFQMEQTNQKMDTASEINAEITDKENSDIPKDELSDVEILDASEFSAPVSEETRAQKTIETPFGTVVIDDDRADKNRQSSSRSKDVGAELIIESKEEKKSERMPHSNFETKKKEEKIQKSDEERFERSNELKTSEKLPESPVKPKPWPQFNPSPSKFKSETKAETKAETKVPLTSRTDSKSNSSPKSDFQYDEIKTKNLPGFSASVNTNNDSKADFRNDSKSIKQRQINQKIVFEEIESGTKSSLSDNMKKSESGQKDQKKPYQNQNERQIQNSQNERQIQNNQNEQQAQNEQQNRKEQNKNDFTDSEKSKLWYEERFKTAPPQKKEYPPYI
jgi:N-acetylglucosamine-1-phosphate uridyltransferase (contains nucleotidyltransferase and I-patch acetyltransferase domains)